MKICQEIQQQFVTMIATGDFKSIVQNRDENPRMRKIFNSKSPPKVRACADSRRDFRTTDLKFPVVVCRAVFDLCLACADTAALLQQFASMGSRVKLTCTPQGEVTMVTSSKFIW